MYIATFVGDPSLDLLVGACRLVGLNLRLSILRVSNERRSAEIGLNA